MVSMQRARRRGRAAGHRPYAEEAALLLSLVIVGVLGMTLLTLLLLEFLEILPGGLDTIAFLSLVVFTVVVGRALVSRAFSTPSSYRGHTPILRHLGR